MRISFVTGPPLFGKGPSDGSQVARILEHFAGITSLDLYVYRYLVSFELPTNLRTLSIRCSLKTLPSILEILADPIQAPLLRKLRHIRAFLPMSRPDRERLVGTVTRAMVERAIHGLEARKDLEDLESVKTMLYALVY